MLRTPNARSHYNVDSVMFQVQYPGGLPDEFLSYEELKDTDAWKTYCDLYLTPRPGHVVGMDADGNEIVSYSQVHHETPFKGMMLLICLYL